MITAVDTNILLDILIPDAPAQDTSQQLLDAALEQGGLVISEIVYIERECVELLQETHAPED